MGVGFGVGTALPGFVFGVVNRFGLVGLARVLVLGFVVLFLDVLIRPKSNTVISWYFPPILPNSFQILGFPGCFEICGHCGGFGGLIFSLFLLRIFSYRFLFPIFFSVSH